MSTIGRFGSKKSKGHHDEYRPRSLADLKSRPARYLPPAGPYYDQHDLKMIFGEDLCGSKCVHCLSGECTAYHPKDCTGPCGVCGQRTHKGKECQMLYCSFGWWVEQGHRPPEDFAIRPGYQEAHVLGREGLIRAINDNVSEIIPNMSHPIVASLYRGDPPPRKMTSRVTPQSNVKNSSAVLPAGSTKSSLPPHDSTKSSLPRSSSTKSPPPPSALSRSSPPPVSFTSAVDDTTKNDDCLRELEDRLIGEQEATAEQARTIADLKEEIKQLKNQGIIKDRKIRDLENELGSLRNSLSGLRDESNKRRRI